MFQSHLVMNAKLLDAPSSRGLQGQLSIQTSQNVFHRSPPVSFLLVSLGTPPPRKQPCGPDTQSKMTFSTHQSIQKKSYSMFKEHTITLFSTQSFLEALVTAAFICFEAEPFAAQVTCNIPNNTECCSEFLISCLCLPSIEIAGVHHLTWILLSSLCYERNG